MVHRRIVTPCQEILLLAGDAKLPRHSGNSAKRLPRSFFQARWETLGESHGGIPMGCGFPQLPDLLMIKKINYRTKNDHKD